MKVKGFQDTIEWYNQNAAKYADASIQSSSVHDREQFENFISKLQQNAKVLDAGCGSGRDSNRFFQNGFEVTGIDLSHGLINEAKKRFQKITFIEGNLLALPFEKNSFDGIWSHASLLHLEKVEDVQKALQEFHRVLKKSGVLHVLVKAQKGKEKTAVVSDSLSGHDRFFQYFTVEEIKNLLETSGFGVEQIHQYNEADRNPGGRSEVEWIISLSRKI